MPAPLHSPDFSARAALAEHSVLRLYGSRFLGLPGTLLGRDQHPETRPLRVRAGQWNYWWQAHFVDALVDAGWRSLTAGRRRAGRDHLNMGRAVVRGIQARNLGRFPNDFYDDMAWLVLALERLNRLAQRIEGAGDPLAQEAANRLYGELTSACTPDLGGGAYWSKKRDFKNTPATAPIALALARAGRFAQARELLNWLRDRLYDTDSGLYLDGIRISGGSDQSPGTRLERALYTYNQGPVLGAYLVLLEAGETDGLQVDPVEHISTVLEATDAHFGQNLELPDGQGTQRVLATQGTGDGGLFTGILVRYLADLALAPQLPEATRSRARAAVLGTAELFWAGRREFDPDLPLNEPGIDPSQIRGQAVALFSPDVRRHISEVNKPGAPLDFSTQLQAWMTLEAAARLRAEPGGSGQTGGAGL